MKAVNVPAQLRTLVIFASLAASLAAGHAMAQTTVTVDMAKPVNIMSDTAIGFPANTFDGNSFSTAGAPYLKIAGVTTPRFFGNHGIADLYHWSTKTTTRWKGADGPYFAPEANFVNFALMAEKTGNAVIVVNYGSNMEGTGGGEPAEAAAWVAYANGDPQSTHPLGKDSTGQDWRTVGYWASLRASAPLDTDDGLNWLRIEHPKPFGFKLWQIGDQVYNNGYMGGDRVGNPDLHGPAPAAAKDYGKLKHDAKLSPAAFAENVKLFAAAMKGADPEIQVGVGVTTPPSAYKGKPAPGSFNEWNSGNNDDKSGPEWNSIVLKGACKDIDFVSMDWETGNPLPPDWKTLDEANLFPDSLYQISGIIAPMLEEYKGNCPSGHVPRIALSSARMKTWLKMGHPIVTALWVANIYSTLAEAGFLNTDWTEAYGDSMMSADHKKFGPAYYGLQSIHIIAHSAGDALLDASSSNPTVYAHATRRRDGVFGLMLVNTDPKSAAKVRVQIKGGEVATSGKRFDYGPTQLAAGTGLAVSAQSEGGSDFTVTVPAYSITDVLLPITK